MNEYIYINYTYFILLIKYTIEYRLGRFGYLYFRKVNFKINIISNNILIITYIFLFSWFFYYSAIILVKMQFIN